MLGQRHYYLQLLKRTGHPQQAADLFLPLLTFLSYFSAKEGMSCITIYIGYLLVHHLIYKHYQFCIAFYLYLFFNKDKEQISRNNCTSQ